MHQHHLGRWLAEPLPNSDFKPASYLHRWKLQVQGCVSFPRHSDASSPGSKPPGLMSFKNSFSSRIYGPTAPVVWSRAANQGRGQASGSQYL